MLRPRRCLNAWCAFDCACGGLGAYPHPDSIPASPEEAKVSLAAPKVSRAPGAAPGVFDQRRSLLTPELCLTNEDHRTVSRRSTNFVLNPSSSDFLVMAGCAGLNRVSNLRISPDPEPTSLKEISHNTRDGSCDTLE